MTTHPPGVPEVPIWSRFSADPRLRPDVRASDADRELALDVVNTGYGEGRLDAAEYDHRLQVVLQARWLGDLAPMVADLIATSTASAARRQSAVPVRKVRDRAIRTWLALAVLFNVIWVATWLFSGNAPYYYWPIWPMIGTAIPAMIPFFIPDGGHRREPPSSQLPR
ncbi:MAG: DUF1707 domain-containing protein [Propioniciclava sp.]